MKRSSHFVLLLSLFLISASIRNLAAEPEVISAEFYFQPPPYSGSLIQFIIDADNKAVLQFLPEQSQVEFIHDDKNKPLSTSRSKYVEVKETESLIHKSLQKIPEFFVDSTGNPAPTIAMKLVGNQAPEENARFVTLAGTMSFLVAESMKDYSLENLNLEKNDEVSIPDTNITVMGTKPPSPNKLILPAPSLHPDGSHPVALRIPDGALRYFYGSFIRFKREDGSFVPQYAGRARSKSTHIKKKGAPPQTYLGLTVYPKESPVDTTLLLSIPEKVRTVRIPYRLTVMIPESP